MPQISLNAMTGVPNYQTMRVKGHVKKQALHLLADCGSTHNFLDLHDARRLRCNMSKTCLLQVSVANGQVMSSIYECKNFKWSIQGQEFETDVMILPLGGCEIVLGIQWLATLGTIQFDFKNLERKMGGSLSQMGVEISSMALCVCPVTLMQISHDHTIPLLPHTPPINIRPYKHPPNQKDAIELMVKDILEAGAIRNSQNYRMLNKYTMKDKFPILVIEELLDELHGAKVFSKLELRSGYHQIRMNNDDIHKTTFMTHEGHYEFLHTLFAKESKCTFAASQVKYLGHIINAKGVSTDPAKIQAMESWPTPQTVKQLRGFLGHDPNTRLPDFQKTFVVETDASRVGIGAVLQQEGHPIAYLSKTLEPKHQARSTYEKELTTPFQTKWLPKLLGFDYEISYNKGTENIVADALSRLNSDSELNAMVLSTVTSDLLSKIKTGYGQDTSPQKIIQQLREGTSANNKYQWERNILKRKGKLVVGSDEQLRATIVQHYHADATDLAAHPGLLQPLPIPERIWSDISMDFIVGLPRSQGKTVIFVVVDRLSKYAHFVALSHPYTASFVAQAFLDSVYKLHGLPDSIVSDRDSVFMSHFWQSLFKILKVELKMSTAYHPQTDGQTEAVS
ncbi:retrotransposon-related protein [Tanacetum coccineum]